jgi:hypothetical protein
MSVNTLINNPTIMTALGLPSKTVNITSGASTPIPTSEITYLTYTFTPTKLGQLEISFIFNFLSLVGTAVNVFANIKINGAQNGFLWTTTSNAVNGYNNSVGSIVYNNTTLSPLTITLNVSSALTLATSTNYGSMTITGNVL